MAKSAKIAEPKSSEFRPYIDPNDRTVPEFTLRAVLIGCVFGVLFGAATVYVALRAGLSVSASIPIAVIAISFGKLLRTSILENNIIQTTGSAGESIAAGVVFTLPAFIFLSDGVGKEYFSYMTILMISVFGGILGTLMMIPLRRSLIVKEHGTLPYPEGTACAHVLIAGEKGGSFALTAYLGMAFASVYAVLQKVFEVISTDPHWSTSALNKYLPAAKVAGEITPEYLGVGYIIGPKICGVLVAGGILASFGITPLIATLVDPQTTANQLQKLDLLDASKPDTKYGWNPDTKVFSNPADAIYRAFVRQIGAGAVAAAGFITLLKTLPTIFSSVKDSLASIGRNDGQDRLRTEDDLSLLIVVLGSVALVGLMAFLPNLPGNSIPQKLVIGVLVIIFGFFFVTVASRIVGLIGASNSPISGMTIATIMGTALVFISMKWTGKVYEPLALVVGSMICIAAANAGATSQDLKTGFIVGATPRAQQLALFIGAIVSSLAIGWTVKILDNPTADLKALGIEHAIGDKYPAPQATLMATLIKGLLSFNLDWQFVLIGAFVAITMELCGVKALSFAVGLYLPLATTLPIWVGGFLRGASDWLRGAKGSAEEEELGSGSLFATGLVAGGALIGVIHAILSALQSDDPEKWSVGKAIAGLSRQAALTDSLGGKPSYMLLGVGCFAVLGLILFGFSFLKQRETKENTA